MGDRKNKLIEKILSNDKLVEYLDSEDWPNFWCYLKKAGAKTPSKIISKGDLEEFKKIVPGAFNDIVLLDKRDQPFFCVSNGTDYLGTKTTNDLKNIEELDNINDNITIGFLDKDNGLKYIENNIKHRGELHCQFIGSSPAGFLKISDKYEIYIEVFFIEE